MTKTDQASKRRGCPRSTSLPGKRGLHGLFPEQLLPQRLRRQRGVVTFGSKKQQAGGFEVPLENFLRTCRTVSSVPVSLGFGGVFCGLFLVMFGASLLTVCRAEVVDDKGWCCGGLPW